MMSLVLTVGCLVWDVSLQVELLDIFDRVGFLDSLEDLNLLRHMPPGFWDRTRKYSRRVAAFNATWTTTENSSKGTGFLPENRPFHPKGNEKVFQPSIFRCYVCFREGIIFKRFRHLKARQFDELKKVERIGNAEQKS